MRLELLKNPKILILLCFFILSALFVHYFKTINRELDVTSLVENWQTEGRLVVLNDWEMTFHACPPGVKENLLSCKILNTTPLVLSMPAKDSLKEVFSKLSEQPNTVQLRHSLSIQERTYLSKYNFWNLVIPRSVQNKIVSDHNGQHSEYRGVGRNVNFPYDAKELLESGEIKIDLFFGDLPWFGPSDWPAALAKNEVADSYLQIQKNVWFSEILPDVLIMSLAILFCLFALVLDHSPAFLAMTLYVVSRSIRLFCANLIQFLPAGKTYLYLFYLASDGAVIGFALLSIALMFQLIPKISSRVILLISAIIFIIPASSYLFFETSSLDLALQSSDLWADLLICGLFLMLLPMALKKLHENATSISQKTQARINQPHIYLQAIRIFMVSAGVIIHTWSSFDALQIKASGGVRPHLDWRANALLPLWIATSLLSVGSISRHMIKYAISMRGRLESILSGTKEMVTSRTSLVAAVHSARNIICEIKCLQNAELEIYIPANSKNVSDRIQKYALSAQQCRERFSPAFIAFVPFSNSFENSLCKSNSEQLISSVHRNSNWKCTIIFKSDQCKNLATEDLDYVNTLMQSLAITLENLETYEALRRADKLKDEFLANTSHELKTPLVGIIGLSDSLIDGATGPLSLQTLQHLNLISFSARRLSHLVNDILDFSKLREQAVELKLRAVDLKVLTDIVLSVSKPLIGKKEIILINSISQNFKTALADESRLQQIFYNLVGNAIKFTEKGTIEVNAKYENETILVTISDSGEGIDKDRQSEIFKSFVQADGSTERKHGGTGLGLAVTQKLVELHGGEIWVESERGSGSRFTFTLKTSTDVPQSSTDNIILGARYADSSEMISQNAIELQNPSQQNEDFSLKHKILIVDDEAVNRQVLVSQLSALPYELQVASSGKEALELIWKDKPDVVLLDIMMPEMSGLEVCARIREKFEASDLPVVMLTAKNQLGDLVAGFEAGANDFLTKPFTKKELLARVRAHIQIATTTHAYSRFVPNDLLRILGREHIVDVKLGDQVQREMTILFLDIRSFTRLSEGMTPKENFDFLNSYFKTINPVVVRNKGFIDKYIGDAILALFPECPDDALNASAELVRELRPFNAGRIAKGLEPISIGLGTHTGKLMLGTIGNEARMEGTVISDAVNLASRIEGMSKFFGVPVLTSLQTIRKLKPESQFTTRVLGRVRAKGSSKILEIAEVFDGDEEQLRNLKIATREEFENGLNCYYIKDFKGSAKHFESVLKINESDGAAQFYHKRSKALIANPPFGSWEGVEELRDK